jgi:flagellar biosynthesis/type III secretory pathway protein FliH
VLASLGLNPAQVEQISVFIDTYLKLNTEEEEVFNSQIATIEPKQKEQVMEIVTSWMEKGIEKGKELGKKLGKEEGIEIGREEGMQLGRELGKQEEAASFVLRLLQRRFGNLSQSQKELIQSLSAKRLEELGEALLDFNSITDLKTWLARV